MKLTIVLCLLVIAVPTFAGTFKDNFDDGNMNGWQVYSFVEGQGLWTVEKGKLNGVRASVWSSGLVIGEDDWKDYSVEFDATLQTKLADWSLIAMALHFNGNEQQWHEVKFYIDNSLEATYQNDLISEAGCVGILFGGCVAEFDNVVITGANVPDFGSTGFAVSSKDKLTTTWSEIRRGK